MAGAMDDFLKLAGSGIDEKSPAPAGMAPANQQKILEQTFGSGNVSTIQHDGEESSFVVKDKDNRWYQADPNFSWKNLEGSLRDTPSDIAQFAGEFGVRSAGAMIGASMA